MQYGLDYSGRLPVSAQEGMQKADDNADVRWKHMINASIVACARRLKELTVDDVLEEMGGINNCPENHSLDALGPAMMRAAKMGVIRNTHKVTRGKRPESHGNRHTIWASNYYGGSQ